MYKRVLYYSQHYIRCIDYIKDKECIVLTVVSKENDRHSHSIQTSMSHNADHQSSKNLATFLHTGMTFSCTNVLRDHCKKSHASKLLDKLEYLRHILRPSELMKTLQIQKELVYWSCNKDSQEFYQKGKRTPTYAKISIAIYNSQCQNVD